MKVLIIIPLVLSLGGVLTASLPTRHRGLDADVSQLPVFADTLGEGCSFDSIELHGKVQIVDVFPDIRVQLVDAFPDIKVKWVTSFPDDCGEWEEVDVFPDFKVQIVDAFPDIKVQIVESFPGIGRQEEG